MDGRRIQPDCGEQNPDLRVNVARVAWGGHDEETSSIRLCVANFEIAGGKHMKGQTSFSGAALQASVSIAALLIGGAAVAQTTPAAMPAAEPAEDVLIQVIGTRVVRDGYQSPTPVSVVGADEIARSATPNVADYVNTLPAISGSSTPRTTVAQVGAGRQGVNSINLRGIGDVRTLTLLLRAAYDKCIVELGIRSVVAGDTLKAAQRVAAAAEAAAA